MDIINLTPHELNIKNIEGNMITIPTSGTIARVESHSVELLSVAGFSVMHQIYGRVYDLPDPKHNTIYIVSALVLIRVPERYDVFAVGEAIRDENGRIVGANGLSQ